MVLLLMLNIEHTEIEEKAEKVQDQHLVFDGTVSLDDSDDDQIPRVKGLIELLNQYFGDKSVQNHQSFCISTRTLQFYMSGVLFSR
jgi:hypothetical protein